ncbi:MAG: hypothetical protein A2521_06770 [Deltaproteobacteria bacterium RIFOXYD12_FULL_57_12]|nr:MAG: hypothetical protein A2521_06770 [Deltaproteobacteria bacterium RIFOXYD12_FULL_57_12]
MISGKNIVDLFGKNKKLGLGLAVLCLVALAVAAALFLLFEMEKPQVNIADDLSVLGAKRDLRFTVSDKRSGIQSITILLTQNDKKSELYQKSFPRQGYSFHAGPNQLEETIVVDSRSLGLKDGLASLLFTVRDFSLWGWLKGNETVLEIPVTVDMTPPQITLIDATRYIAPGGSGVVVYRLQEPTTVHGVMVNGNFNPGFPVTDGRDGKFVAFIGLAYDTVKLEKTLITASDKAGNQGTTGFVMNLLPAKAKSDRINISDDFLNTKMPEFMQYYPEMTGTPVEQYLYINNKIREKNSEQIKEICGKTAPERLWQGIFGRMPGSTKAGYADHRTYYYQDKEIDRQVHLGIDLAGTSRMPAKAANSGKVAFVGYLGIYGNTVIIDHGQGLFSLYSHLSQIDVAVDTPTTRDTVIGLSGLTGMAGGDHLHFAILVNGVFVTPIEWWDPHWLKVSVEDQLSR